MRNLDSLIALRSFVKDNRKAGKTISFVPTMGALHDGHIELVRQGLARTDICIPYIFVNPKQFAPTEDLASYPRTLESDLEKLRSVAASAVYLPSMNDIYPEDFATSVTVSMAMRMAAPDWCLRCFMTCRPQRSAAPSRAGSRR